MKIKMPIKRFNLRENKVYINDLVVEYEGISDEHRAVLESLISRGAYASALLTLNKFYDVKLIKESGKPITYLDYLTECGRLLKECVVEGEAQKPNELINIDGLSLCESLGKVYRKVGDKYFYEDFRAGKTVISERYMSTAKYGSPVWHTYKVGDNVYEFRCTTWETRGGWGHNVILTYNYDTIAETDVRYYNRTWEMWEFQTAMEEVCRKAMKSHKDLEPELKQVYDLIQEGNRGETSEMTRSTISESAKVFNRDEAKKVLGGGNIVVISKKGYVPTNFIVADGVVFYNNKEISFGWNKHPSMKTDEDLLDFMEKMSGEGYTISYNMTEEAEGTQCSDIPEKKDQEVGSLQKAKKPKKFIVKEGRKTQDFLNQLDADNTAKRLAGITGNGDMTLDQYMQYQEYMRDIRKKDTSRYDITISYWDRAGYPKEKTYIGRSVKEIARKFVSARDKVYSYREISGYSDNLDELLSNSDFTDMEEFLDYIANGGSVETKMEEMLNVPRNHGFKGFMMNESGIYQRGNYVLINESGKIKAVNKKNLKERFDIDLAYKAMHLNIDLENAMVEGAMRVLSIDENEVKDYCSIDIVEDEDNKDYVRVYFLAEVSYDEGTRIVDEYLDKVITKYDKDSYFEAETTGRWYALVRKDMLWQ